MNVQTMRDIPLQILCEIKRIRAKYTTSRLKLGAIWPVPLATFLPDAVTRARLMFIAIENGKKEIFQQNDNMLICILNE